MSPAPNSSRNRSQRSSHSTTVGGAERDGPRNTARKPVSSSSDSQPKLYQSWPTFTIDRYSTHIRAQTSIAPHRGALSTRPNRMAAEATMPIHATAAKSRSE